MIELFFFYIFSTHISGKQHIERYRNNAHRVHGRVHVRHVRTRQNAQRPLRDIDSIHRRGIGSDVFAVAETKNAEKIEFPAERDKNQNGRTKDQSEVESEV